MCSSGRRRAAARRSCCCCTAPARPPIRGAAWRRCWRGMPAWWRLDLPGHGFSGPAARGDGATLPGMARGVRGAAAAAGAAPTVLVGPLGRRRDRGAHGAGRAAGRAAAIVSLNGALLPLHGLAGQLFSPLAKLLAANRLVPQLFAWRAADPARVRRLIAGTGSTLDDEGVALYGRLVARPGACGRRAGDDGALGPAARWPPRCRGCARRCTCWSASATAPCRRRTRSAWPRSAAAGASAQPARPGPPGARGRPAGRAAAAAAAAGRGRRPLRPLSGHSASCFKHSDSRTSCFTNSVAAGVGGRARRLQRKHLAAWQQVGHRQHHRRLPSRPVWASAADVMARQSLPSAQAGDAHAVVDVLGDGLDSPMLSHLSTR